MYSNGLYIIYYECLQLKFSCCGSNKLSNSSSCSVVRSWFGLSIISNVFWCPKSRSARVRLKPFYNTLVSMDVHPNAPDCHIMPCQYLRHSIHKSSPRINLKQFWPLHWLTLVSAAATSVGFRDQRRSFLVVTGHINHSKGMLVCFTSDLVIW